jgi:cobalt transporter subunit CbtA|tara:strand:- start:662 stop:1381 length:720 start_codon:yes stop_codon:yes gene_type:complete
MFRSIVLTALGVALIVGMFLSAVQALSVSPIITAAEVFEIAEPEAAIAHSDGHTHAHNAQAWGPSDGIERVAFTVLSNVLSAFGFTLILLVCMCVARDKGALTISWLRGLVWGLAGYLTFFVVPALGLTPEIPGMEAAVIEGRQSWWFLAVLSTGLGLAFLVFLLGVAKVFAVIIIAAPWVVGAPQPELHGFLHPDAQAVATLEGLQTQFIYATALTNGLFWITLGGVTGYAAKRFIKV